MTSRFLSPLICTGLVTTLIISTTDEIWAQLGDVHLEAVVLNGDPAPDVSPGSTFFSFNDISINDAGDIAFRAFLTAPGAFDCTLGLWSGSPNQLSLVACEGEPAPDTEEGTVYRGPGGGFPGTTILNERGQVAFSSLLTNDTGDVIDDEGIWRGAAGEVSMIVREGDQAPGLPEGTWFVGTGDARMAFNNEGHVAFFGHIQGPTIEHDCNNGIWLSRQPWDLAPITYACAPAPGVDDVVTFSHFLFDSNPVVNDQGEVAFLAVITGPDVDFTTGNNTGLWIGGPDNLQLAVRQGDPVPGLDGAVFEAFNTPTLNNSGQIAFHAWISGLGGLWTGTPSALAPVAMVGDPAPGTEEGVVFSGFLGSPYLNGNGQVAFLAFVNGPGVTNENSTGIWVGRPGELELVIREGVEVPGSIPGQYIYGIAQGDLYLNARGDVAFGGLLIGFGAPRGTWLKPLGHELLPLAVPGQAVEVKPGDVRTVIASDFSAANEGSGNQDGKRSRLSDTGVAAVRIAFDDGTQGVFRIGSVVPPQPPQSPQERLASLIQFVQGLGLETGIEQSLVRQLSAALKKIKDENSRNNSSAVAMLNAFASHVGSLHHKHMQPENATILISKSEEIRDLIGNQ